MGKLLFYTSFSSSNYNESTYINYLFIIIFIIIVIYFNNSVNNIGSTHSAVGKIVDKKKKINAYKNVYGFDLSTNVNTHQ